MVNVDHFALNWIPVVVVTAVWNIRVLDNWNCSKRHKRFCSWMYSLVSSSIIAHYVLCLCKMYTLTWMVDSKVEFTVGMLSKRFTSTFCTTTKAPVFMAGSACLPHSLHLIVAGVVVSMILNSLLLDEGPSLMGDTWLKFFYMVAAFN